MKGIKIFLKKRKTKSKNMVVNKIRIPQIANRHNANLPECKKQSLVGYRKKYYKIWKISPTSQIKSN